jgi:peptidoglycan/LPS O-acetylase OafA/YrhL
MLVFTVAVFRDLLPRFEVGLLRGDALAALGYVANWRMIYRGDDYFAQTAAPSVLQHTWSLGIEEQFYVLWPLLVVVLVALAGRRARPVLVALCLGRGGGLGGRGRRCCSTARREPAYFGTDTRAQALLIGAALAAALPLVRRRTEPSSPVPARPARSPRCCWRWR